MKPARLSGGFSLIEALLTLLILSFGLLGLGQLQARLWRAGGDLHAVQNALLLAQNTLETAGSDGPVVPGNASQSTAPYGLEILVTTVKPPLTVIRVTLRWRRPSGQHSLQLAATRNTALRPQDTRWLLPTP